MRTKQLYGKAVNASMLTTLAQSYVDAINDGAVPNIKKVRFLTEILEGFRRFCR